MRAEFSCVITPLPQAAFKPTDHSATLVSTLDLMKKKEMASWQKFRVPL